MAEIIEYTFHAPKEEELTEDVKITFDGTESFVYDNNGDIYLEESSLDRVMNFTVVALKNITQQELDGATRTWLFNNQQLSTAIYETKDNDNSMIRTIYLDLDGNLHYTVKNKYDINKVNNELTLILTTPNHKYSFKKEIYFSKVGEPGTNGTQYSCELVLDPKDIWRINNENYITPTLKVYKNGQQIYNYREEKKWIRYSLDNKGNRIRETADSLTELKPSDKFKLTDRFLYQVTVELSISNYKNNREKNETIYNTIQAYFPYPFKNTDDVITQYTIPTLIRYNANGTNPYFYSNNFMINNKPVELSYNGESYSKAELQTVVDEAFNYDSVMYQDNGIYVQDHNYIYDDEKFYFPILCYLNSYGNDSINNWDGVSISLGDVDGHTVLTNQIVAGTKNSDNQFSGVVMGKDSQQKTEGIYGYKNGETRFYIDINGDCMLKGEIEATFGHIGGWNITENEIFTDWTESSTPGHQIKAILAADSGLKILSQKFNEETKTYEDEGFIIFSSVSETGEVVIPGLKGNPYLCLGHSSKSSVVLGGHTLVLREDKCDINFDTDQVFFNGVSLADLLKNPDQPHKPSKSECRSLAKIFVSSHELGTSLIWSEEYDRWKNNNNINTRRKSQEVEQLVIDDSGHEEAWEVTENEAYTAFIDLAW